MNNTVEEFKKTEKLKNSLFQLRKDEIRRNINNIAELKKSLKENGINKDPVDIFERMMYKGKIKVNGITFIDSHQADKFQIKENDVIVHRKKLRCKKYVIKSDTFLYEFKSDYFWVIFFQLKPLVKNKFSEMF